MKEIFKGQIKKEVENSQIQFSIGFPMVLGQMTKIKAKEDPHQDIDLISFENT